ncbi:uncharacterized protein LOC135374221 [Ornithodoros turicata]|uniref:uncharacterized protein LOC135374221 n=1 Tax=Ornithodoros turicata TaxID=34597 RepID=UPI003139D1DB
MDQQHFFIVKFPGGDNDVAVLHSTWAEDGHCWWPPERISNKLRSMIVRGHAPLQSWNKVECSVIDRFCTYEEARRKLPHAEHTSDLQSDVDSRRLRKKRSRLTSSTDSDSSDGELELPPPPDITNSVKRAQQEARKPPCPPGAAVPSGPSEDYSGECTVLSQDISHGYQASSNYARHGLVLQEHASSQQLGQHAGGFQQGAASSPWSPFLGEGRGYVGENNSIGPQGPTVQQGYHCGYVCS